MEELAQDLEIQERLRSIVSENVSKNQDRAKGRAQHGGTVFKPGDGRTCAVSREKVGSWMLVSWDPVQSSISKQKCRYSR